MMKRQGRAPCRQRRQSAEADLPNQTVASQGRKRKGQGRWGKLRPGRDTCNTGPACSCDRGRHLPLHQSGGWPMFFALLSSLTARSRHTSKRRRIPMPASPRRRARSNRHEALSGIVALISCCLVLLITAGGLGPPGEIVTLPACTQQISRRGAALASEPPGPACEKRW